jgi:hypothetical protein
MNPANQKKKPQPYIKSRDLLMLALIRGATKASVAKDQRKEASRKACRQYRGED